MSTGLRERINTALSAFSVTKPACSPNAPIVAFPSGEWEVAQSEGLVAVFADLLLPGLHLGVRGPGLSMLYPLTDRPLKLSRQLGQPSSSMLVFLH